MAVPRGKNSRSKQSPGRQVRGRRSCPGGNHPLVSSGSGRTPECSHHLLRVMGVVVVIVVCVFVSFLRQMTSLQFSRHAFCNRASIFPIICQTCYGHHGGISETRVTLAARKYCTSYVQVSAQMHDFIAFHHLRNFVYPKPKIFVGRALLIHRGPYIRTC